MTSGWRGLGFFWLAVVLVFGGGAIALQMLGPPPPAQPARLARPAQPTPPRVEEPKPKPLVSVTPEIPASQRPGRDIPGPIADPDPALLQTGPDGGKLPRIADDGRMPMQVYAAAFDRTTRRPRIGVVIAGIGLDTAASTAAIRDLPSGITLAVSPYAHDPQKLLDAARLAQHEYLLSLPMEPQSFPLNDPGNRALMTSLSPEQNHDRLDWLLSRIAGYAGVTSALGSMRGERFSAVAEQMDPVLKELAERGLLFVDARPGQPPLPHVWQRDVDLVLDEPASEIEGKLADLERLARNKGSALGLAGAPRPVTMQRIAAWANGLAERGFALAPVSALAQPPADADKPK